MNQAAATVDIREAEFLFGAPDLKAIRKVSGPEVAIIGRSNVGKSSFINRLCKRKLARVSGRPGCTTELNFYHVAGKVAEGPFDLSLVDMPGFGYARLSKVEREDISRLVVSYFRGRKYLKVVILLNDCRRAPEADERAIQGLCIEEGIRCIIVATKLDSIKRSQHEKVLRELARGYNLERGDILATGDGISPADVWGRIVTLLE